jgi:hypothetical protein
MEMVTGKSYSQLMKEDIFYIPKRPIRAKFWDCSDPGRYFITVITAGRQPILGEILNGKMILSHIGEIVEEEWYTSFVVRHSMRHLQKSRKKYCIHIWKLLLSFAKT